LFNPKFNYSHKTVQNLTYITESKTIIMNAHLVPEWEISLRKDAILRSAHFSTAIEGNSLSLKEVTALEKGRNIMARRKDKQEVLNYINTLKKIDKYASKELFELEDLFEIHKNLTKETLNNPNHEGVLRDCQVYVGGADGSIRFMPPDTNKVYGLLNDFLEWFNSLSLDEINPVIVSGITHYEIVRIHPFIDGNGRTARIMAALVLYKSGFDLKRFFTLDDYYDMDRPNYYRALQSVNQDTLDLTRWLEYFSEGVAVSMKNVKDKVLELSMNAKILKEKGQVPLNERQMEIVEKIISNNKITNKTIREMFNISDTAARTETANLEKLGIIKRTGDGRNTHYVLNY